MTRIDPSIVVHVARLARLAVPAAELGGAAADFGAILGHFDTLGALDGEPVVAEALTDSDGCPLRRDQVEPAADAAALLQRAPLAADGHFVVPRIID